MTDLRCPKCDAVAPVDGGRLCAQCGSALALEGGNADAARDPHIGTLDTVYQQDEAGRADLARDPYVGTLIAGRFFLEAVIAQGGMGVVYRAIQFPLGRRVAVKILRRELFGNAAESEQVVDLFRREALIVTRLSHPNVVMLHDFGDCGDGNLFMAFELLEGLTLQDVLRDGPLPVPRALNIAMQLASGLSAAHANGIVHRDLKPGNVILVPDPAGGDEIVKLVDFGIARLSEGEAIIDDNRHTLTGKVTGTPNYMSPEQIHGEVVDARADVYALGLILHEMLTGRPAFVGRTPITIVMAQLNDPPPPLRDSMGGRLLPPGIEEVVDRALRKARDERFSRATDLRRALEAVNRRSELTALWANKGDEPEAVFAILRAHSDVIVDTIVDDIKHSVESYRTQARADVRQRVGFFFKWCTQVAPEEAPLAAYVDHIHRLGAISGLSMADMISAFSLVFPVMRVIVEGFEPDARALVQGHWSTLERHFWLLLRVITSRFEAVLLDPARDTWVVGKVPVAPRETAPRYRLPSRESPASDAKASDAEASDAADSGDFFENVLASMQSGLLVVELGRLTIRAANPAFERILDLPARELVGRHVLDAFRPLRGLDVAGFIAQLRERGELPPTKIRVRTPGGRDRWIKLRGGLYRDQHKRLGGVMILVDDVTEREFLVDSFRRYVGAEIVEELLVTRRGIQLAGQKMQITALFVGLMGPEGPGSVPDLALDARPEETIAQLNRYFSIVVEAVTAERGLVDTFVKDRVMALFGAPFGHEDDAFAAVRGARRIRDQVALFNAELDASGHAPMRLGMGLATGPAIVGNVGTTERVNYTALGEVVYRADRLRTRAAAGQILLDEATAAAMSGRVPLENVVTNEGRAFQVQETR